MNDQDRAVVYIDGNNWYHATKGVGVPNTFDLSYVKMSVKLLGPRVWLGTRYYIGQLKQSWDAQDYANQRRFLSVIRNEDTRITTHLGRLERREVENPLVPPLLRLLDDPKMRVPKVAQNQIKGLVRGFSDVETLKEKAVDVMLARDMIVGAMKDEFDAAYLLSADGDFTPVVETLREMEKKVYCASPGFSSQLQRKATAFITLDREWFTDCYR